MRINREEFLKQLESVLPGLSTKEVIEQSSCFIFQDGNVCTFNDEIACSQNSLLKIEGVVPAMPFISILRKLQEEELDVDVNDNGTYVIIKAKRKQSGINMEKDVLLPIDAVDKPKKWKNLPDNFADAVSIVKDCAGTNESEFALTCIHISPKWIEACNMYQVTRYKIKTDIDFSVEEEVVTKSKKYIKNFKRSSGMPSKSILVRKESLKHIVSLDMTKFSETKHWIHFKNSDDLILSCRRFIEDYPSEDLTQVLKVKGEPLVLPKGLKDVIEKAQIFSSENVGENQIIVNIKKDKFKVTGKGVSGWYTEVKKSKYDGKSLQFTVPPKILAEIVQQHNECEVTSDRLKVKGEGFEYVTVLNRLEEKND